MFLIDEGFMVPCSKRVTAKMHEEIAKFRANLFVSSLCIGRLSTHQKISKRVGYQSNNIRLLTIKALDMMRYRPENTNFDRGEAEALDIIQLWTFQLVYMM